MARLIRVSTSFAAVLTAYCVYAVVAVPLIEPPARSPRSRPARVDRSRAASRVDAGLAELEGLIPPEARQKLEHPKILESEQLKLLLCDYTNLGDGRVRIQPCLLIYKPGGGGEGAAAAPIVLYAPDGALMRFDRPLDLRRGNVGRPVSGRLLGEITIRSPGRQPGPHDDLEIITRDVQLTGDRISTQNPVRFRYGASFGSGRNLEITLLDDEDRPRAGKESFKITGIELFEIRQLDRLHLEFPEARPAAAAGAGQAADTSNWDSRRPLEITCRGPFRFDPVRQFATFAEQVDVLQLNPNGPVDQINCERLTIHFSRSRQGLLELSAPNRAARRAGQSGETSLQVREIEAIGNPVIVRAPTRDAEARGERLGYDVQQEQIVLEGSGEVFLRQGKNEIRARSVRYRSKGKGRLGELFSQGPGWMRGELADRPGQEVLVRWGQQFQLQPYEEQHVASLAGDVELNYSGIGNLKAGEVHCWLFEIPAGPGHEKLEVKPDRMLVQGHEAGNATPAAPSRQRSLPRELPPVAGDRNPASRYAVEIDSPQIFGGVNRMEVWFEEPSRPAAATAAPGLPVAVPPAGPPAAAPLAERLEASPAEPLQRRFRVRGQLVQSRVLIRERRGELSELMLEGDVELDEIPLLPASEQPIRVSGDRIQAIDAESPNTNISVIGRPAQFRGRGLTLTGTNINVNAGTNRLWIDGSGQMELPLDRDLKGEPLAKPGAIQVSWQQRMDFDGQTALFEEAVTANTASEVLRTETLEVRFTRPIQFRQAGSQPAPDLDRLTCRGGVLFEGRGFEESAQVSWQQFEAGQLSIDRTRGEIHAQGPGRVTSIRPRVANLTLRRGAEPPAALPPPSPGGKLACLDVRFQDSLSGDINNRKLVFHDQVQSVYGDVASWQSRLDIHDPDALGETGVKLSADQLSVAEAITPLTGRQTVELEALGNVIAENRTYTARASRLTYSESKDLLILEGNGHVPAELAHQKFIGGPVLTSAARQIYFWPSTKSVKVADGRSLEMNVIEGP